MGWFDTSAETSDRASKEELRTRYYTTSYAAIKDVIVNKITQEFDMSLNACDDKYKEIYLVGDGYEIIFSIIEYNPQKSAVDMKCNFFGYIGMNRPMKKIKKVYELLAQNFQLKGIGLN